jgi:CHRD domain
LAALGSRASASGSVPQASMVDPGNSGSDRSGVLRQPLLALSRARRGLSGILAHSSHSSHASHASHSSHVSSSTPAPSAPVVVGQATHLLATLNAAQEVPVVSGAGVGAGGRFTATLQGRMLHWRLTFAHLSSPETAVALHAGAPGQVGPGLATIAHSVHSPATGTVVLSAAQVSELLRGKTYVNVGTSSYPHGEIRGGITKVSPSSPAPAPSSGAGVGHSSHVSHASHASHASHSSHVSSG